MPRHHRRSPAAETPLWRRYLRLFGADPQADLDAEIAFHLAMREAEYRDAGADPAAARERAHARFGDLAAIRRDCLRHDRRTERRRNLRQSLAALGDDLAASGRMVRRRPAFAAGVVATLALGLASSILLFAVLDRMLLRPLPYPDADRLHLIEGSLSEDGAADPAAGMRMPWSYPKYTALRDHLGLTAELAGWTTMATNLAAPAAADTAATVTEVAPQRVEAELVTAAYFAVLGIQPSHGRGFTPSEEVPGQGAVAVLSDSLWRRSFAASPAVLGRSVELDGLPLIVVGIAPRGMHGLSGRADLWVPVAMCPQLVSPRRLEQRHAHWLTVVARAAPGVGPEALRAAVGAAGTAVASAVDSPGWGAIATRLDAASRPPETQRALLLLQLAGLVLLTIVCANAGGLLLARALARRRELAVRLAIGAGRARLLRQLVVETALLALLGAAIGLGLAELGWRTLLLAGHSADLPLVTALARRPGALDPLLGDPRLLAFAAVAALLTALGSVAAPAARIARQDPARWLTAASGGDGRRNRLRASLVVAETALALVLVLAAALLASSLGRLQRLEIGVRADGVWAAAVDLPRASYDPERVRRLYEELTARLDALPGVAASAIASCLPLSGGCDVTVATLAEAPGGTEPPAVGAHLVTPGHLDTLGIPLLAGRGFTTADRTGAPKVALVDATAARLLWPGRNPLGQRLDLGIGWPPEGELATIVGVVGDVRYGRPEEPSRPNVYVPAFQHAYETGWLLIASAGDPRTLAPAVREVLRELDPTLPLARQGPLADRLATATAPARWSTRAVTLLALLATALAAIGLYGVLAAAVAARRSELGVRQALGARRRDLVLLVVRQAGALVALGLALGLLGGLATGRLLAGWLYEITPGDPAAVGLAVLLILAAAVCALALPAWRAGRVDPAVALREG